MRQEDKINAAVRILPSHYRCDQISDFNVANFSHHSFVTTMYPTKLSEIVESISERHGKGVEVEPAYDGTDCIVTLLYHPNYFNAARSFPDFVLWIEALWRTGLADYRRSVPHVTYC